MQGGDERRHRRFWPNALLIVSGFVLIDQLVKWLVVEELGPDAEAHRLELAGRYLAIEYVENRGAAFGILNGQTTLLIVLAVGVSIMFLVAYRREVVGSTRLQVALPLIAAGAIGNLIDRVRLGYVVDYIAVGLWPKFNVADSCITIAILLLARHALSAPNNDTQETEAYHGTAAEDRP